MKHVAIIGAGLSGLSCAKRLSADFKVTIFDKSRGVSGRMSTRYAGSFEFDHGAQYFTARDPDFQEQVLQAISTGHIAPWQGWAIYKKGGRIEEDHGSDRFVAIPRMNSWAKALAKGLNVKTGIRVIQLERSGEQWTLSDEQGVSYTGYDEVVLAIPPAQAEALLPHNTSIMAPVKAAKMDACFALMLGFDNALNLGWTSLRVDSSPIAWIARNSSKPARGTASTLMVHTNPAWSNAHADDDREKLMRVIIDETSRITGMNAAQAVHKSLHRWLYASVASSPNQACLRDDDKKLTVCGDWCLGGRVENAWLSGRAAAQAINGS